MFDTVDKIRAIKAAKENDLIKLPEDIKGTNCGNCRFFTLGFCHHPKLLLHVKKDWCCSLWDAKGSVRIWKEYESGKIKAK